LIRTQQYVIDADIEFRNVALGLFESKEFRNFFLDSFGSGYYSETKTEWSHVLKDIILYDFNTIISKLNDLD